jgi:hypothetical protein
MPKTREEIDALKDNWRTDPSWDIEKTEGFEEHHDELLVWREKYEAECDARQKERDAIRAKKVTKETGITGELAEIIKPFSDVENHVKRIFSIAFEDLPGPGYVQTNLMADQVRATLLLAAQVKRVADQLEANENNRMVEDDVRATRELYQASK